MRKIAINLETEKRNASRSLPVMNYDCTTHPILPFITLLQSFLQNIALKRYLIDTEMNGYHCFNFTEKLSYKV